MFSYTSLRHRILSIGLIVTQVGIQQFQHELMVRMRAPPRHGHEECDKYQQERKGEYV